MPNAKGLVLLKEFKRVSKHIPVIITTRSGTIEAGVDAMSEGAFDYVTKPINFKAFQFIVAEALKYVRVIKTQKDHSNE